MRRRLVLIAAILVLAAPLAFLLRDVARHVFLIRILRTAWDVRLAFESLPQTWLWTAAVAIALLVALKSLMGRETPSRPPEGVAEEQLGRIATLTKQIQRSWQSEYSRRSLARDLRALAIELLAHRHRSTSEQMWQQLRDGSLDVPPDILGYLNLERWPTHSEATHLFARLKRRLFSRSRAFQVDPELERIVQFLEAELEGPSWPADGAEIGGIE